MGDPVSIIIGSNVSDYETVFNHLCLFLDKHLDGACCFVVSEKSNGFVKYLLSRLCYALVMTPGKEEEMLLKHSILGAIVTAKPLEKAFKLKDRCDDRRLHTMMLVMHVPNLNPVNSPR